jgi:hypothetical protein
MEGDGMAVKTSIVVITPAKAEEMLAGNNRNRPVRPVAIARYAHDMKEGNWILNGEAIKRDENGDLRDGQNRLLACLMAGTPFETLLIEGIDAKAMDTIDIGVGRTLADVMFWKDVKSPRTVATALTWCWRYQFMLDKELRQFPTSGYSRADLLEYFDANPGLTYSAQVIEKLRKKLPMSTGIATFVHYLMTQVSSRTRADQFFGEVAEGTGADGSPSYLLREWLLDHQTPMTRKSPTWVAAVTIKAARFYLQGVNVQRLSWKRSNQRKGEEFPRIDTPLV